jgi:hypothetical protein
MLNARIKIRSRKPHAEVVYSRAFNRRGTKELHGRFLNSINDREGDEE